MQSYARRLLDSASSAVVADSPLLAVAVNTTYRLATNETNSGTPPYDPGSDVYMTSHFTPSMAIIIVVLLSAFFFMAFFSIYVRRCTTDEEFNPEISRRPRPGQGLDRAIVESLPMVNYSADAVKEDNDSSGCVVCLTDFEDGEPLRILPKCQHCFHSACIDLWLNSHTTCPMCRRSLLPDKEGSQHGGLNQVMVTRNEGNAIRDAPVDAQVSNEVGDDLSLVTPDVAVVVRDAGTEQGESTDVLPTEDQVPIAQQLSVPGEADLSGEPSWRLHDSPIHGVTSTSPALPLQNRNTTIPQSRLTRANSTGHSLVKRAFNRANCLVPSECDELGRPTYSCLPIATAAMHRSKSQIALPLSFINRDEDVEGESEMSAMRRVDNSRRWNFSLKGGFSLRISPEGILATTAGDSSSTSIRRTFDRLPV